MLHRSGPFRLFVTVLLAMAVPFCCCNFHSLLSGCVPCEVEPNQAAVAPVTHHHADDSAHEHGSDDHADHGAVSTDGSEPGPSPCGPGHNDDDDCACGKHCSFLTIARPTLEFPTPVLVAIFSLPTIVDFGTSNPIMMAGRGLWVFVRPPTTLLLLHCALIV